jgi:MFS family permease
MLPSFLTGRTARGLTLLYISTLFAGVGWSMILPIIPQFADEFGISNGLAIQVVTGFGIGRFIGTPLSGYIVDRFGSRLALVGGPLLAAAAAIVSAFTPWFGAIIVAAMFVGAGESMWAFGREIAGLDITSASQRGRVLSGFHGVHGAGLAVGPLIGGIVADTIGLRAVFLAFAIESTAAVLIGLTIANSRSQRRAAVEPKAQPPGLTRWDPREWIRTLHSLILRIQPELRTTYALLVYATFAGFLFRQGMQGLLPIFADEKLGLSSTQIGLLFSFAGVIVIALTLPTGLVIDKIGRKWATVPSTMLPGLAFLLLPFAESFLVLIPLVAVMGVANGLSLGSLATSTYDVVPPEVRGRLQAVRRTIADTAAIGAPAIGGLLANAYGPAVPFVVYAPFILLAGLLLMLFGKETISKRADQSETTR